MSTNEELRTDVDAAAELAAEPTIIPTDAGDRGMVLLPPGWTVDSYDEERDLDRPRRAFANVDVFDGASFVAMVERRQMSGPAPVIYADEDTLALVAVLNDDEADLAGWRDNRVRLGLRPTPEWAHWSKLDGKMVEQAAFAEHIEDGLNELRDPAPAIMLDIAQSIHGHVNARVKAARRLTDGRVQFAYEEDAGAQAGEGGELTIPETLTLVLAPFVGSPAYEMTARFRYRLGRGEVTLGYKLDRPHKVKAAAFADIRTEVEAGLPNAAVINGPAPSER
jgi:uncharacterized protein YfdQ (DUF2303 family)